MSTFYVSTDPQYYGSDSTDLQARECALVIIGRACEAYPQVDFRIGVHRHDMSDEQAQEIQQYINDRWPDWCQNVAQ